MVSYLSRTAVSAADRTYAIPYSRLDDSHIAVWVNEVPVSQGSLPTEFTVVGDDVILGASVPLATDDVVLNFRDTVRTPLIDFQPGQSISDRHLDIISTQGLYLAEEARDWGVFNKNDIAGPRLFSEGVDGAVAGPTAGDISGDYVLQADGAWVPQSRGGGGGVGDQDASEVAFDPQGTISAGNVQNALEELDGDVVALTSDVTAAESDILDAQADATQALLDASGAQADADAAQADADAAQATADAKYTDVTFAGDGVPGTVPDPGAESGQFLKDDGTWDTPAGGGGGASDLDDLGDVSGAAAGATGSTLIKDSDGDYKPQPSLPTNLSSNPVDANKLLVSDGADMVDKGNADYTPNGAPSTADVLVGWTDAAGVFQTIQISTILGLGPQELDDLSDFDKAGRANADIAAFDSALGDMVMVTPEVTDLGSKQDLDLMIWNTTRGTWEPAEISASSGKIVVLKTAPSTPGGTDGRILIDFGAVVDSDLDDSDYGVADVSLSNLDVKVWNSVRGTWECAEISAASAKISVLKTAPGTAGGADGRFLIDLGVVEIDDIDDIPAPVDSTDDDKALIYKGGASGSRTFAWETPGGGSSGFTTGTSFPVSPADDDLHFHTTDSLFYYWDDTKSKWLGTHVETLGFAKTSLANGNAIYPMGSINTNNEPEGYELPYDYTVVGWSFASSSTPDASDRLILMEAGTTLATWTLSATRTQSDITVDVDFDADNNLRMEGDVINSPLTDVVFLLYLRRRNS